MNHLTEHGLRKTLSDLPLGGIRFLKQTGSTNDVALAWAAEGAADLSLVVAEEQTAGRGRFGRKWVTAPGTALAFSLILRPKLEEVESIALYSALGALEIATTLEEKYALKPEIKWPNDVLLARQKVCGILAETVWLENRAESVVLGIGLNVRAEAIPSAESFSFPAISLETATGQGVDRIKLLHAIITALIAWRPRVGCGEFIRAWEDRLAFRGERVQVWAEDQPVRAGQVEGLDRDGGLRLRPLEGEAFTVRFGEVHLRPV
ncbi:MAG: biotin--[acetyl-CoA-carboxylase] ligase [Anaerolineales bacterium]|nr:biotin--[acetyl-CoA-carboxylase] ligase [Anaerolineales bacterium]